MSQAGSFIKGGGPAVVETLTGNTGGAVGPDGSNNINVVGDGTTATVAGNPGTHTLTISTAGSVPIQFDEDVGTAVPAAGILNIHGSTNINTSGASNTVTINLNDSITQPATNNIYAGTAGSQGWYALGGSRFMHAYGTDNTFLGTNAGNNTLTGSDNTGIGGSTLTVLTSGNSNVVVGGGAGSAISSGASNTIIGAFAAISLTNGNNNVYIGNSAGASMVSGAGNCTAVGTISQQATTGIQNTSVGYGTLTTTTTGTNNTVIGYNAGNNYTSSESSNILIGSSVIGTRTESNTIHIGNQGSGSGQQNACYIAGIVGVTVSNAQFVTINSSTGQLGIQSSGTVATQYTGNSGIATPSAGNLNILGVNNITTTGSGSTIDISVSGTTQHSLLLGNSTGSINSLGVATNGQLPIGSTGADPVLATLSTGTGISITNGAGSITITSTGGGLTWNEITGTSASMAINNGYIANNAALVTLTLPSTAAQGSIIRTAGKGAGLYSVAQNAGQTVHYGNTSTTTGTGGSLTAIAQYNSLELVCITANTDFVVLSSVGNFTVV